MTPVELPPFVLKRARWIHLNLTPWTGLMGQERPERSVDFEVEIQGEEMLRAVLY